nr:hypothetical protein Iba_chr04aCG24110 [Ipomoea batatas]
MKVPSPISTLDSFIPSKTRLIASKDPAFPSFRRISSQICRLGSDSGCAKAHLKRLKAESGGRCLDLRSETEAAEGEVVAEIETNGSRRCENVEEKSFGEFKDMVKGDIFAKHDETPIEAIQQACSVQYQATRGPYYNKISMAREEDHSVSHHRFLKEKSCVKLVKMKKVPSPISTLDSFISSKTRLIAPKDPAFPSLRRISSQICRLGSNSGCSKAQSKRLRAEVSSLSRRRVSRRCLRAKSGGRCLDLRSEIVAAEGEFEAEIETNSSRR